MFSGSLRQPRIRKSMPVSGWLWFYACPFLPQGLFAHQAETKLISELPKKVAW